MYVLPVLTLSNEKKPNELVVVNWLTPFESVIDIVAFAQTAAVGCQDTF